MTFVSSQKMIKIVVISVFVTLFLVIGGIIGFTCYRKRQVAKLRSLVSSAIVKKMTSKKSSQVSPTKMSPAVEQEEVTKKQKSLRQAKLVMVKEDAAEHRESDDEEEKVPSRREDQS